MRIFALTLCAVVVGIGACTETFEAAKHEGEGGSADAGAPQLSNGGEPVANGGSANVAGTAGTALGEAGAESGMAGAVAAAGAATRGGYAEAILADEPLVYWRMGETANGVVLDETGGGNDLVLQGGGHELHVPGAVPGDTAGAMGFDGSKSFAIASDARALDFAEGAAFSLECWAQRENGGASYYQYLFANIQGVANDREGYALYLLPEPASDDSGRSAFEYDKPMMDLGVWGALPAEGAWAHYAAIFDGSKISIYVDGTLGSQYEVAGKLLARSAAFAVARHSQNDGFFFKGALDELAVYDRALTVADIARHVAATK
jgi:hypothetical protein